MPAKLGAGLIWGVQQYRYQRPLEAMPGEPQARQPEGVTFTLIDRQNVGWIGNLRGAGEVWRFRRFLNRGDVGIYALSNDEVIHYSWVALSLPGSTWVHAHNPIGAGDALLHRGYTRKDYRCRGVATYGVTYVMGILRERYRQRGLQRVNALVRTDSPIPQHLFAGLGFCKTQQLWLVRLLGTCFVYWARDISMDATASKNSPRRLLVRFKAPEILWDPRMPIARAMFR